MRKQSRRGKRSNDGFCINLNNDVFSFHSDQIVSNGMVGFSSEQELSRRTAKWPVSRLVEIWNKLPQVKKVTKFTNRRTALHRIWTSIQALHQNSKLDSAAKELTRNDANRPNTKTAKIISLLQQPSGATLKAIMDATGWQAHSVRAFLSAQLSKKRSLHIESSIRDGERVYRIRK